MRYPAKETAVEHERIVKEPSRMLRERGFENVSVGEVMKAAAVAYGLKAWLERAQHSNSEKGT